MLAWNSCEYVDGYWVSKLGHTLLITHAQQVSYTRYNMHAQRPHAQAVVRQLPVFQCSML